MIDLDACQASACACILFAISGPSLWDYVYWLRITKSGWEMAPPLGFSLATKKVYAFLINWHSHLMLFAAADALPEPPLLLPVLAPCCPLLLLLLLLCWRLPAAAAAA
jgi:hypothetical protein